MKKILDSTQSHLDEIKVEKKHLANEVTESVAKIASLEDELADEKLKREHSSFDLQDQLEREKKLRQILEERLSSLKTRYEKELSKSGNSNWDSDNPGLRNDGKDAKRKTDHQLLIEVRKNTSYLKQDYGF